MYKWIPFTRRFLRLIYQYCFVIILHAIYFALLKQPLPELKWFGFIFGALAVSYTFREMFSRGVYLLIIHLIGQTIISNLVLHCLELMPQI